MFKTDTTGAGADRNGNAVCVSNAATAPTRVAVAVRGPIRSVDVGLRGKIDRNFAPLIAAVGFVLAAAFGAVQPASAQSSGATGADQALPLLSRQTTDAPRTADLTNDPIGGSGDDMRFASAREAFAQGVGAYVRGQYEIAVPALKAASRMGVFYAPFYLARIYSGNNPAYVNHAAAFAIYSEIVRRYGNQIDYADYRRAPTLAKSITEVAKYIFRGLPSAGLQADKTRAILLLTHAAQVFSDPDAQFELARLQIVGDGVPKNTREGLYWMKRLISRGHAGAQATMADLLWRGKYVDANPTLALGLIALARRNAPPSERIWIEDSYQNIYCGAPGNVRESARGYVAGWDQHYGQNRSNLGRGTTPPMSGGNESAQDGIGGGLDDLVGPTRTCANGEMINGLVPATGQDGRAERDGAQQGMAPASNGSAPTILRGAGLPVSTEGRLEVAPSTDLQTRAELSASSVTRLGPDLSANNTEGQPTERARPAGMELIEPLRR